MSKVGIIIKKEYLRRVNKKSFLIFTFLTPLLIVALVAIPLWLSTIKDDNVKNIAVIDATDKYEKVLKDNEMYHFVPLSSELDDLSKEEKSNYTAFVIISADLIEKPDALSIYSEKQVTTELKEFVKNQLESNVRNEKLNSYKIDNIKEIIKSSEIDLNVKTLTWSEDGQEKVGSAELATGIGLVATFMIYMFIFMYGAMVMRGVMEEKTSRIIEVLVSSVKPIELMMGKIIGIALVGLTQFLLWVIFSTGLFFALGLIFGLNHMPDAAMMQNNMTHMAANVPNSQVLEVMKVVSNINFAQIILYFILYFIGGYLLYASLFAAVGSAVDNETDTQQFMLPITIPIIFAMYAGLYSAQNPDGPLAFWCSMIPFTSPIVMMVRLPFDVPFWQLALSLFILYVTFFGVVRLSAKIYRTGILMYGKKVNYKEIWKWIKY